MKYSIQPIDGNWQKLDGGAMFGHVPQALWSRWVEADELGRIPLACRSFLVEIKGVKILIEAGIGAFFSPELSQRFGVQSPESHLLLDRLRERGLSPSDIDVVLLSHLHFDHCGGLANRYEDQLKNGFQLVFDQAEFWVGEVAWQRALFPHARDRSSFIPEITQALEESQRLVTFSHIETEEVALSFSNDLQLKGKSQYWDKVKERLSFFFSEGHTPGQMLTRLELEKGQFDFFCGDLIPGSHWVHLPVTMGYDRFAEKVIDEKSWVLEQAAEQGWRLLLTHDTDHPIVTVKKDDKGRFKATPFLR